ncbi:MAG: hypothetical protein K9G33_03815 [Sneathiella sp.]|nr:hypothetical protein [Sneathiella sp.]
MVKKQPVASDTKTAQTKQHDPRKPKGKVTDHSSKPVAVDRPGFDLGGSTRKTSAGTGLGLGQDASDSPGGRSLPGRRGKSE